MILTDTNVVSNVLNASYTTDSPALIAPFETEDVSYISSLDDATGTINLGAATVGGSQPFTVTFTGLPAGYTYDSAGVVTLAATTAGEYSVTRTVANGTAPDLVTIIQWVVESTAQAVLYNASASNNPNTGVATLGVNSTINAGVLYVAWYSGSQTAKTPADIVNGTGAIDFTNAPADFSNQFTVPFQSWDANYFAAFTQEIPDAGFSQVFYTSIGDFALVRPSEATGVDFEGKDIHCR